MGLGLIDATYLGHCINDGGKFNGVGTKAAVYESASTSAVNMKLTIASLHGCQLAVNSLGNISARHELYLCYGRVSSSPKRQTPPFSTNTWMAPLTTEAFPKGPLSEGGGMSTRTETLTLGEFERG